MENISQEQESDNLQNVAVQEVEGKGRGLFARKDFKKGELIWTLYGDIVTYATDYTVPINATEKIEPRLSKGVGQYMNHSCEPNTHPDKTGRRYIAMKNIQQGEELTTHYGFLGYSFGQEKSIDGQRAITFDLTCHCGAKNCKSKLRAYNDFTDEEKETYKEYVLPFLLKEKV